MKQETFFGVRKDSEKHHQKRFLFMKEKHHCQ